VKDISMKDRSDVVILVKLAGTNKQTGGGLIKAPSAGGG